MLLAAAHATLKINFVGVVPSINNLMLMEGRSPEMSALALELPGQSGGEPRSCVRDFVRTPNFSAPSWTCLLS
jgi:hypothetical protein